MLKVSQVAKLLNCSVSTAYQLIETGKLGHHRCPGVRVSDEQIKDYLDATRREPQERTTARRRPARQTLKHIRLPV
jgi:excisionase family DNA binding protein